jgi:hypothetical protein
MISFVFSLGTFLLYLVFVQKITAEGGWWWVCGYTSFRFGVNLVSFLIL